MDQQQQIIDAIGATADFGQLVGFYVEWRDEVEAIKREMTDRTEPIKKRMDRTENRILELLQASGQESAKTKFGTAYKVPKVSAKVADWNVLLGYIQKNEAYDLLVKNVSKEAVKARIDETGEIVPGVDIVTIQGLNVRRS